MSHLVDDYTDTMLAESLTTWTGAEIVVDYVGHNVGVVIDSVDKMSA